MNKLPNYEQRMLEIFEERGAVCQSCGKLTKVEVDCEDDHFGREYIFVSACCGQGVGIANSKEWKPSN